MLPVLFLSHESPFLWDTSSRARDFLLSLGKRLPEPRAILVVSAHWMTDTPTISSCPLPETIYDFSGFPEHYNQIRYPAAGSPEYAKRIKVLLETHDIKANLDEHRGFDHAVWVPIGLMYPQAILPVISLSIQPRTTTKEHFRLGQALKRLREEGILIVGSGTATHNLKAFFSGEPPKLQGKPDAKALAFSEWLIHAVEHKLHEEVLKFKKFAPHASHCHPTKDHFLPLVVAMGAGEDSEAKCIHQSFNYEHFAMTSFRWS